MFFHFLIPFPFPGSVLAKYITRFAEEVIELLVATLFLYEVGKKLKKTFNKYPLHPTGSKYGDATSYDKTPANYSSYTTHVHDDHTHSSHAHTPTPSSTTATTTTATTMMMTMVTEVAEATMTGVVKTGNYSAYEHEGDYGASSSSSSYGSSSSSSAYEKKKSPLVFPFALIIIAVTFLISHILDRFKRSKVKWCCSFVVVVVSLLLLLLLLLFRYCCCCCYCCSCCCFLAQPKKDL